MIRTVGVSILMLLAGCAGLLCSASVRAQGGNPREPIVVHGIDDEGRNNTGRIDPTTIRQEEQLVVFWVHETSTGGPRGRIDARGRIAFHCERREFANLDTIIYAPDGRVIQRESRPLISAQFKGVPPSDYENKVLVAVCGLRRNPVATNSVPASTPATPKRASIAPAQRQDGSQRFVGSGSGFIVTTLGHMVTNAHVIAACTSLRVKVRGTVYDARVVAADPRNDLALLQLFHCSTGRRVN